MNLFKSALIVLLLVSISTGLSQTVSGRLEDFDTQENPSDSILSIVLQIKLDEGESEILGNAFNLKFDFDTLALQFIEGTYVNFNEAEGYQTSPIVRPGGSPTIQNIGTTLVTGSGREVTEQYTDFVVFKFQMLDFSGVAFVCPHANANGFQFYSPGVNTRWNSGSWLCFEKIIPVELVLFTASVVSNSVVLKWSTATELNNSGFEIERNGQIIGFVQGNGTASGRNEYSYVDNPSGTEFRYRLKQIDYDGSFAWSNEVLVSLVSDYVLLQNYPNPFNGSTRITYQVSIPSNVNLTIYDILGREVEVIVSGHQDAGTYSVDFHSDKSSAIYLCILTVNGQPVVKKMVVLK